MSDRRVEWIRAQLDATEERARLALEAVSGKWDWELIAQQLHACCDTVPNIGRTGQHLHHNADPAAVLADVAAKRAILDEHYGEHECRICSDRIPDELRAPGGDLWLRREPVPCKTVRLLAEGFRGRPGYEEAMRDE